MQHSETITSILPAVLKVMSAVESIEKNLEVGTGKSQYKGVADKDVKQQVRKAMIENNLVILPADIEPEVSISEWDATESWNGQETVKHKMQVFTKVKAFYRLFHAPTGEWIDLVGYGHGVDSQDKSAGKATTYALKYALLNSYLIPTGDIDDTDTTHSNDLPQKPVGAPKIVGSVPNCPIHHVPFIKGIYGLYHSHKVGNTWENCKGTGYYVSKKTVAPVIPEDETPMPVDNENY